TPWEAEGPPVFLRRLERVDRVAVGAVADRVNAHGQASLGAAADDPLELLAARALDAAPVEQPRGPRPERPIHERLQVADPDERAAEAAPDPDGRDLLDLVVRQRLPDPQRQRRLGLEALPDAERAEPAVLVVAGRDRAGPR